MNAISSFRPLHEHEEYRRNQMAAKESWIEAFDSVFYFNEPCPEMDGKNVKFIPWDPFPTIRVLADLAAELPGYTAIVNADIIISKAIRNVETTMQVKGFHCAMSRRYQFVPGQPLETAKIVDVGLDIFIASSSMWNNVANTIPTTYRIGHNRWDTFLLGFFNFRRPGGLLDFTGARVVFHPLHKGRRQPFNVPDNSPIPYFGFTGVPRPRMK